MPSDPPIKAIDFAPNSFIYVVVRDFACSCYWPLRALPRTTLDSDAKLCDVVQRLDADRRFQKEAKYGSRYSQVFQFTKGFRLHSADRRRQGCIRAYYRGRACWNEQTQ